MWLVLGLFCCLQFRVVVRLASDAELLQIYKELNAAWFNHKMPEDHLRITWESITERNGDIAFTWITNYEGEGERISIVLSPRMKNCESCTKMLLLHEMARSEEHTSELQSRSDLVCRLLLEKKKKEYRRS